MTVYVLFNSAEYGYSDLVGIFSTKELAQSRLDAYADWDRPYMTIVEWVIDSE